jgi:glycyl-tRNA synthetase
MQDALRILSAYWIERGCVLAQPFNSEVGAGTMNPATILRVLGPEPWRVAYVEPSVRPDDSRYGKNPNRLQTHTQFQVVMKPEPGNPQDLYLGSLQALGIDLRAHDVRFVEDNWAQPAIGAWGLGWEVWLDGLEISQYTYFQQVSGLNLDPVPVELTYGLERIIMALQGVTNFKDIEYAPGLSYGEAFGQIEYEMSRYYLDDADVAANRALYDIYLAEASRLIELKLPVPAHTYVLKSSHAFNVLDARGAISTTERAKSFATMRRLSRDIGQLWVANREASGFPLLKEAARTAHAEPPVATPDGLPRTPQDTVFEIGTEELPPHVVQESVAAVRKAVEERLQNTRLAHGQVAVDGTPRRIAVRIADVEPAEPDAALLRKGPRWSAAYDAAGQPTAALMGFLRSQHAAESDVVKSSFSGADYASIQTQQVGRPAVEVLAGIFASVVSELRADKNMRWNDETLSFSRPIRWLLGLWGPAVLPVRVSRLVNGRTTYGHRFSAQPSLEVADAYAYARVIAESGIVLSFADRRSRIVAYARRLAAEVGGTVAVDDEDQLLDEIANLVEEPTPIVGTFEERYLELPEEILVVVMRKHQRYLPVRDASGKLMPYFIAVANGPCDEDVVRAGNEAVLRARYEDAAFFYDADLQVPLADLRARLSKLTFEDRLGSVAERASRIDQVALALGQLVRLPAADMGTLARAGELVKFDLASQMVIEMPALAGYMAREYALHAGEPVAVADALAEVEQPRTPNAQHPATSAGQLLSVADRLDLLVSMFALGTRPTGSSDPFGLRRAALGVIAVLRSSPLLTPVTVDRGLEAAAAALRAQDVQVTEEAVAEALEFVTGRFLQQLRDEGVTPSLAAALMPCANAPGVACLRLNELQKLMDDPVFRSLVAMLQRIERIVTAGTAPAYDPAQLTDPSELAVISALDQIPPNLGSDLSAFAASAAILIQPVNTFFDEILVMAPDPAVRAARLGLLASARAVAPDYLDWKALHTALNEGPLPDAS